MLLALLLACSDPEAPTPLCWRARWRGYVEQEGRLFGPPEFSTGHHDPGEVAWKGLTDTLDALAASDVAVVVVPVPTRPSALDGFEDTGEREAYAAFLSHVQPHATAIDVLSLARDEPDFFFTHDHHMTPIGVAAVARAVAEQVDVEALAQPLPPARWTRVEQEEERPAGSVVKALQGVCGGRLERPHFRRVVAVRTDPPELLEEEPLPRVVLVGSSQSSSKFDLGGHLALELSTPVLSVPRDGGGVLGGLTTYLASDAWRDAPPALVVWEFPVRSFAPPRVAGRADVTDPAIWDEVLGDIRR